MEVCIQQIHFQNTIDKQNHLYPVDINNNISYEGILKHRKYRCDSLVSFFIYPEYVMRTLPVNGFQSKLFYVLRYLRYNHLTSNVSKIFI